MGCTRSDERVVRGVSRVGLLLVLCGFAAACSSRAILTPNLQSGERSSFFPQHAEVLHLATNGLNILLVPDENTNLVKVDVRYAVGAIEDPVDKPGLAHLVEHLTYSARHFGANGPTLAQQLGRDVLYFNAYTGHEATHYTSMALGVKLTALLALEARRMASRCELIDDGELERVRAVVRNEIRERTGVHSEMVRAFIRTVYGAKHPYSKSVGGTDQALAAITRVDVCAFMAAHYRPSAAILAISGNFDKQTIKSLIAAHFGNIPKVSGPTRAPIERVSLGGTATRHELPVEQATAVIAFEAPRLLDRDAVVAHLTGALLRRKLFSILRKHDFVVDIDTGSGGGSRAPVTYVAVSVKHPKRLKEAVKLVFEQVGEIGKGMSLEDLNNLRNRARASLISSVESFANQTNIYIKYVQAGDDRSFLVRDIREVGGVSIPELQSYALKYLAQDVSHVAYFYPKSGTKIVEQRAALRFESDRDHDQDREVAISPKDAENPVAVVDKRPKAARVREFSLANGMSVYLAPTLSYPVVDIRVVFPAGRAHDPAGKQGLARLTALLFEPDFKPHHFKNLTRQGVDNIKQVLQMGGDYDWEVDDMTTSFRMRGLSMYADGLLWRLYFLLKSATYEESSLNEFRALMKRGEDAEDDAPDWPGIVMTALFGKDYPIGIRGLTRDSVNQISVSDLRKFRDSHYRPGGAAIIVTGQFDAESIENEIRRLFGGWTGTATSKPRPMPKPVPRRQPAYFASVDDEEVQTSIIMAFATQPTTAKRIAARLVLNEVIRDKLGVLRSQLGSTYGADLTYSALRGAGILILTAAVDRERSGEAFVAMRDALTELRAGKFLGEFVRARRLIVRRLMASTINSRTVANQLESKAMYGIDRGDRDKIVQQVANLRLDQVRALIDEELAANREVVVVLGKRAEIDATYRAAAIQRYRVIE